jgi:hypothetical protein
MTLRTPHRSASFQLAEIDRRRKNNRKLEACATRKSCASIVSRSAQGSAHSRMKMRNRRYYCTLGPVSGNHKGHRQPGKPPSRAHRPD